MSNERKEDVEMGGAVEEGLKERCSHRDASVSGQGELMKMSNRGIHRSILAFLKDSNGRAKKCWRNGAGKM